MCGPQFIFVPPELLFQSLFSLFFFGQNSIAEHTCTQGVKPFIAESVLNSEERLLDSREEHVCCFYLFIFVIA
jgi:hypothetical protein